MVKVSICIPTKNGELTIGECLEAVFKQKFRDFEVEAIDSGSNDSTLDIVKKYPVNLRKIKPQEFNHGKTRNDLASNAKGDIVVFLSQDAIPANEDWLINLVGPILNEEVVATSGKQAPRKHSTLIEQHFCEWRFPNKEVIYNGKTKFSFDEILFSTVNCAIKKDLLLEHAFVENAMIQGQDKLWATQIVLRGYKVAYVPEAIVNHSHPPDLIPSFKEYFDRGMSRAQIRRNNLVTKGFIKSDGRNIVSASKFLADLIKYFHRKGHKSQIPRAFIYYLLIFCGLFLGKHLAFLPRRIVAGLSKHPLNVSD